MTDRVMTTVLPSGFPDDVTEDRRLTSAILSFLK